MTLFKKQHIEIGDIEVGKVQQIIFEGKEKLPKDLRMTASCGCSKPMLDVENNRVVVTFKPKPVPVHLKKRGWYTTTKFLTVISNSLDHREALSFKSTIYVKK